MSQRVPGVAASQKLAQKLLNSGVSVMGVRAEASDSKYFAHYKAGEHSLRVAGVRREV